MADKIQIPVEIQPHKFEEFRNELNGLIDPSKLSADAQILFSSLASSFQIAQANMEKQFAEGKFNLPELNLKKIDAQIYSFIKKVKEDMSEALPAGFEEAQKALELIDEDMGKVAKQQQSLIEELKAVTPADAQIKKEMPGQRFGTGNETSTLGRIAELEKEITNTKNKRDLTKIEKELKFQKRYLELLQQQKDKVNDLQKRQGVLNGTMTNLQASRQQQIETQEALLKTQSATLPEDIKKLIEFRKKYNLTQQEAIKFQAVYNQLKSQGIIKSGQATAANKKEASSIAEKASKTLIYNTVFNALKRTVTDAIQTMAKLDKTLTEAAIVTSMTREETWALIGTYQKLAKETGIATSEIASTVTEFLRQGRSMEDAMKLAEIAAKSAKVASISANDAVNYLTSAVNGFGLAAEQSEDIADKFAAVAAKSATSFKELALAMSKVSPTAYSAGVSIDFMMGVIAKGIETTREAPENIGTAFKTIFARMREVTDLGKSMEDGMSLNRVEKALLSVGVPLRDVAGQFRNLEDVLIDVGDKWEYLSGVEQAYLATALAGSRQQPRLLAIFNDFARTKELIQLSADATGELSLQHMEYMSGMEAAMSNLRTAWEGFLTSILSSELLISIVNGLTTVVEGLANAFGSVLGPLESNIVLFSSLAILFYKTNSGFQSLVNNIGKTVIKIGEFTAGLFKSNAAKAAGVTLDQKEIVSNKLKTIAQTASTKARQAELRAMLKENGMTVTNTQLKQYDQIITGKGVKNKEKLTAAILKNSAAKAGNAGASGAEAAGQTVANAATVKGTVATIGLGKALIFATFGLIVLVPLILGVVAGLVDFVKQGNSAEGSVSNLGKVFKQIGIFFKDFIMMFVYVMKAFFDLGKSFTKLILSLATGSKKAGGIFVIFEMFFALFSVTVKGIGVVFKLLGNYISENMDAFSDWLDTIWQGIIDIPIIGWVIEQLANIVNNFTKWLQNLSDEMDEILFDIDAFGESMKIVNASFLTLTKDTATFDSLIKELTELEDKAYQTEEEMERVKQIIEELEKMEVEGISYDIFDVDADGNRTLNTAKLENAMTDMENRVTEYRENINEELDKAFKLSDDKKIFDNKNVLMSAKLLAASYAKEISKGLEAGDTDAEATISAGLRNAIQNADAEFFETFQIGSGENARFDESGLQTFLTTTANKLLGVYNAVDSITEETNRKRTDAIENIADLDDREAELQKIAIDDLNARADAYEAAKAQLEKITDTEQREMAISFLAASFEDEAILDSLINDRGINADIILNLTSRGASLQNLGNYLNSLIAEFEEQISTKTNAAKTSIMNNLRAGLAAASTGTVGGIELGFQQFAQALRDAGFSEEEYASFINQFSQQIRTLNATQSADLIKSQRQTQEDLFKLREDMLKGDFTKYQDLVAQYGLDAVNDLLNGGDNSDEAIATFFARQREQTISGLNASIQNIRSTASALGRDLTATEEQEISVLLQMIQYYDTIAAHEQLRNYRLKQTQDALKQVNDLIKMQETLLSLGGAEDNPTIAFLDQMILKSQELAEMNLANALKADLEALSEFGSFSEDGQFIFNNDVDTVAGGLALENYIGSLNELLEMQNAIYQRQRKVIEERYKAEIDVIKSSNDEKWKAIEYSDKLAEAEEKITESRRALLGLSLSSASSGAVNQAQKELRELQKERQKMIEQQMVAEAQKQLEIERDVALQNLGEEQLIAMSTLTDSILLLNRTMEEAADDDGDGIPNLLDPDYLST